MPLTPFLRRGSEDDRLNEAFPPELEAPPAGGGLSNLFRLLAGIFAALLIGYFGLRYGYTAFLNREIKQAEEALAELEARVPKTEQDKLIRFYSQLTDLRALLQGHVSVSRFLTVVEDSTNRSVFLTQFDLNVPERRLSLQGVAATRDAFVEQLEAYRVLPAVIRSTVRETALEGPRVRFGVDLYLQPEVFKG